MKDLTRIQAQFDSLSAETQKHVAFILDLLCKDCKEPNDLSLDTGSINKEFAIAKMQDSGFLKSNDPLDSLKETKVKKLLTENVKTKELDKEEQEDIDNFTRDIEEPKSENNLPYLGNDVLDFPVVKDPNSICATSDSVEKFLTKNTLYATIKKKWKGQWKAVAKDLYVSTKTYYSTELPWKEITKFVADAGYDVSKTSTIKWVGRLGVYIALKRKMI